MISFEIIKVGDKVKVVGNGARGYASIGEILEITEVRTDRVYTKRKNGDIAYFALTCGAARLKKVDNSLPLGTGA
jgi:phosphoribosylamine-glycine ligase